MCYMLYLSTDCAEDLAARSTALLRFEKPDPQLPAPAALKNGRAWFVGSKSGCSCTLRHVCRGNTDFDFQEPQDWSPEEPDAIAATKLLYAVLAEIVRGGGQVDLADVWIREGIQPLQPIEVSLSDVSADRFRLFEDHLFTLRP